MFAEIVSTGDELVTGAEFDSNAVHIAEKLAAIDIAVSRHTCVSDEAAALSAVLREIGERSDIAVVTGGLGPAADDRTAEAAAQAAGLRLVANAAAAACMEDFFRAGGGRRRTGANGRQALLPQGAAVIANTRGTTPGFSLVIGGCRFYFLPGAPEEMSAMLAGAVLPEIEGRSRQLDTYRRSRILSTFGMPEAAVSEAMKRFSPNFPDVRWGLRVRFPIVYVRLTASGRAPDALGQELEKAVEQIQEELAGAVFSFEGLSMEAEVGKSLKKKQKTVAVAESCTGGLVAHMLTNVSGSSEYFLLSAVTYANQVKSGLLGVPAGLLEAKGAVHEETARAMAEGIRRIAGADYGIATSGIAGPTGGTPEKPVGTVCIGIAGPEGAYGRRFVFPSRDRLANKRLFAVTALHMLRKRLTGLGSALLDKGWKG